MMHIPVLKNEILDHFSYLENNSDGFFVDGTLGNAGHSISLIKGITKKSNDKASIKIIGIDKDQSALSLATDSIKKAKMYEDFILIHDDFKNIFNILNKVNIKEIDGALLDLGVSSMQLDQKDRGFSFLNTDAKLDMRMDQSQELDAIAIINHYPELRLLQILRDYGEEKFAKQIAHNICRTRKNKHINTVGDLIYILENSIPIKIQKTSRTHFATKTFQAIRIEVNKELIGLNQAIIDFVEALKPGSRLAVITFHSLEDRIVKNTFRYLSSYCVCPPNAPICNCDKTESIKLINKKPIIASEEEIAQNPRSRSAKLRIVEKLN